MLLLVSSTQEAEVYHTVPAELCMYNLRVLDQVIRCAQVHGLRMCILITFYPCNLSIVSVWQCRSSDTTKGGKRGEC
jgi:hypothetical protein